MIQTWKTGSTISCLWPPRADHAGVPVMLPRKSDSDMCRDGANTANVRFQHPVDEPGRVHGVSDPRHIADLASLSSNRGQLLAMKERWRWRKLRKSGSQIRGQDKSRASFGHAMVGFLRVCAYGTAEKCHTQRAKLRAAARFSYGNGYQGRVEAFASSAAIRSEQIAWTARPSSSTQPPSHVSSSSVMR